MVTLDGRFSQNLGEWKNWGWMEWMGWMEVVGVVTPVNSEQGVNRLGTSPLEVVRVDEVGGVNFQMSSG